VVDTHAHLTLCEPPDAELVAAAREAGVKRILTDGLDEETNRDAVGAAERHGEVFASVGRHPNSASGFDDPAAAEIERLAAHPRVLAIGETGLDYYRDQAPREEQRRAFEAQIEIARRTSLPLVVHLRNEGDESEGEASAEALSLLDRLGDGLTVILHCFSAVARVEEAAEHGWYCSFAGNVTFPKSEPLRAAAASVPQELLLVETDCPFLSPQPRRGKPNTPANVVATAGVVAEARGSSYEDLERTVDDNAGRAFGW
jgi:TatD DNase family protein